MSDEEKFPQITPYRPLWEDDDKDKGLEFAVIVSALLIIVGVAYAAALRLLFGG